MTEFANLLRRYLEDSYIARCHENQAGDKIGDGREWSQFHVDVLWEPGLKLGPMALAISAKVREKCGLRVQFGNLALPYVSEQVFAAGWAKAGEVWVRHIRAWVQIPHPDHGLMVPMDMARWDVIVRPVV